jgi:murein L,D-transpeptidase YcbB/YkuD
MLRYLKDLHLGRIEPRSIGFKLSVPAERHDFVALLSGALSGDRLAATAAELRPQLGQYDALQAALVRYRALAAAMDLEPDLPRTAAARPGDDYPAIDALSRRLASFGDLMDAVPAGTSQRYDSAMVEGVKRFQVRHGLEPDGILGDGTQAALRVPVSWRVRQIELGLERLRWLPDLRDQRLLAINIPMFRLWAWDSALPEGPPTLAMDVIVGRALNTQTPVFDQEMKEVVFRPYWNIPRSILIHETLPMIRRDPEYLGRQSMEIVRGAGDDAQVVAATAENLALLQHGQLRVRQRPGPGNALGLVKFVFPNTDNVYMHGTPAPALFRRDRRDFSHGCVRVADPIALAEWALKDHPDWSRARIVEAMAGEQSRHVQLPRPVRVVLFYTTAIVAPETGTVHFAEDIYRHDARLDRALVQSSPSRSAVSN